MSEVAGDLPADAVLEWIVARVAALQGIAPETIEARERFSRYGVDSQGAASLIADLAQAMKRPLSPILMWEHPTPEALARHLAEGAAESPSSTHQNAFTLDDEPIAVIGLSCRLPGALSHAAFWQMLCKGVDAITEVPRDRWDARALFDRDLRVPGKMNTRWGGFIDQVDRFDPQFFGISPREAMQMDPQQRLMLELSWEALEDASLVAAEIKGSRTGVFFGVVWTDYARLLHQGGLAALTQHTVTGFHHSIVANRVSYVLGLQGPSLAVDTACSSSLVAVHLACESLRRGESTTALAGGVNLNLIPESTLGVSKFGGLSPDGRCFAFDSRANGYVRGEGGGVVVLKPLSHALADGDPIYCLIRGSAVNNDGASNGLTAPNPAAQEAVLRAAYARAGIDPVSVDYVEAHGTGTQLGDPIEARALGAVFGAGRPPERPLLLGSAKTNIGHLEPAAGVAGLIKVALAIKHRQIPPSLHFQRPNAHIPFEDLRLKVQTSLDAWPGHSAPVTAGVSAFGFGGTNCHVVLQAVSGQPAELLPLSAPSSGELSSAVKQTLDEACAVSDPASLRALCEQASARCGDHSHRLAVSARSGSELADALGAYLRGEQRPGLSTHVVASDRRVKPAFVFSGQGSQWAGMGTSLMQQEPVFRATLERCDKVVREQLGWSLLRELTVAKERSRIDQIDVSCPAIVALEIALAALFRSWGVEPALVIGHSIGEVAAAHVVGILSLDDAMRVICTQGRLIRRICGRGTMGLVALPWEEAREALSSFEGRLWRAIHESPDSTIISGQPEAIAAIFATLERRKIFCRRINVDVAAHSAQVDSIRAELLEALSGVTPCRASVPVISSVTGGFLDGERFTAEHWVKNLGDPVLFAEAMATLALTDQELLLEVSPHPLIRRAIKACFSGAGREVVALSSLRRDEDERAVLLDTLGGLYALGQPIAWEELYPARRNALDRLTAMVGETETADRGQPSSTEEPEGPFSAYALPLSAHRPEALAALVEASLALLEKADHSVRIADLAFSLSVRRNHHRHRLAVIASTKGEFRNALAELRAGLDPKALVQGHAGSGPRPKVVFVFPGQGSQWLGMGRELLREEPAFRAALEACDQAIHREAGFSVLEVLRGGDGEVPLGSIDSVQPVLFAIEVALAALFREWGAQPDVVVGHSMGEVAAAYVSGALSLTDAAQIICRRSRLLRRVSGKGAMALVELTMEEAARELEDYQDRLSIAVSNGPRSTVIAGDPSALQQVHKRCEERGVFFRHVKVDVASHSPQVEPLLGELHAALDGLTPMTPRVPMHSTVTGEPIARGELDAAYWVQNLRAPVLFARTIERLIRSGHLFFVELSPHPLLLPDIAEALNRGGSDGLALPSLRREQAERRGLLQTLGALYTRGYEVEWARLHPYGGRRLALPSYPWQRERLWIEASLHEAAQPSAPAERQGTATPRLLGGHLASSVQPGVHFWEQVLSPTAFPYLLDHRLRGETVLPGAAYIEMALAAATEIYGAGPLILSQLVFERMLLIPAAEGRTVQLVFTEQAPGHATLQISSREGSAWVRHATLNLKRGEALLSQPNPVVDLRLLQNRCDRWMSGSEHYQRLSAAGLEFGPSFKGVEQLWLGDGEVLARVRLPDEVNAQVLCDVLPPPLLDACFQSLAALFGDGASAFSDATLILTAAQELRLHRRPGGDGWVHGALGLCEGSPGEITGEVKLYDDDGQLLVEIKGLRVQRQAARTDAARDRFADWLYAIKWKREDLDQEAPREPSSGVWVILMDRGGVGAALVPHLQASGQRCVLLFAGEHNRHSEPDTYDIDPRNPGALRAALWKACGEVPLRGVVHLWSLDVPAAAESTPASLEGGQWLGVLSALHLTQAMLAMGWRRSPLLAFVTRGAQSMDSARAERSVSHAIAQAPLWGFGRTLAVEHPELGCRCIDLDPDGGAEDVLPLLRELGLRDGPSDVALRTDGRYVGRLSRASVRSKEERADALAADPAVHGDCAYLIYGGSTGPGLWAAEWLTARGARHLVLVDRADVAADIPRIARIREAGVDVVITRAEAACRDEIDRVLNELDNRSLPLRGVIYAEPPVGERAVLALHAEQLRMALEPAIQCAWTIHKQTLERRLDFFVLFASCASLLGHPGLAGAAAASSFLTATAEERRVGGLRALCIHWAFWHAGEPTAALHAGEEPQAYRGIAPLNTAEGMEVMDRLLGEELPAVSVMKLNVRHFVEFYPTAAGSSLLADLRREGESMRQGPADAPRWRALLTSARQEERAALLEKLICEQLGQTLRQDTSCIHRQAPFRALGLDSLMAMELRNRLESYLEVQLSAALLFTYSDVASLAAYVLSWLGLVEKPAAQAVAPARHDDSWDAIDAEVNQMSDEQAEAALLAVLREIS